MSSQYLRIHSRSLQSTQSIQLMASGELKNYSEVKQVANKDSQFTLCELSPNEEHGQSSNLRPDLLVPVSKSGQQLRAESAPSTAR